MRNKINNKGFTLAEALISMLLVAIMAAGIITALMSTKRAISAPSNKEDLVFVIDAINSRLQTATTSSAKLSEDNSSFSYALSLTPECTSAVNNGVIATIRSKCHNLTSLLPRSCTGISGGASTYLVYNVSSYDNSDSQRTIGFFAKCEEQEI